MRWRQRIGEEGCEWLLEHSIKAAVSAGVLKRQSLATVIVDTTVQPKAVAHPTDSRLLNRAREQLVAAAQDAGIELRQSYTRVGKAADAQAVCTPSSGTPRTSCTRCTPRRSNAPPSMS